MARRKLPEIDAVARTLSMRTKLQSAADCECETLDVCVRLADTIDPSTAPPAPASPPT